MKTSSTGEFVSVVLVIIVGLVLLNPFHVLMPSMLEMMLYGILLIVAAIFTGFVASEKVEDEREEKHRATAGRIGYLSGLSMLILGILVQMFSRASVDQWLIVALLVMITGKIGTRQYLRAKE